VEHSIIVQGNGGVLLSATVANGDITSLTANGEGIKLGDIKVDLKSIAGALAEAFPNGTKPAVAAPPRTHVAERTPPPAKAPGRKPTKATAKKAAPGVNNAIRDWAASKGMKVSDRGRISREVQDAYNAAHNLA
jgi:hypothetical protein